MAFTIGIGPGGFHVPVPGGPGPQLPPAPVPPVLGPGGFPVGPGGIAQPPHFPTTGPGGFPVPYPGGPVAPGPGVPVPHPVDQGFGPGGQPQPIGPGPGSFGNQSTGGQVSGDAQLAHSMSQHLASALAAVRDPELRQSLATAMATLHKYVAGIEKEHQDALAGKVSPRLLRQAYSPGHGMGSVL